jgi:hypothetical protein
LSVFFFFFFFFSSLILFSQDRRLIDVACYCPEPRAKRTISNLKANSKKPKQSVTYDKEDEDDEEPASDEASDSSVATPKRSPAKRSPRKRKSVPHPVSEHPVVVYAPPPIDETQSLKSQLVAIESKLVEEAKRSSELREELREQLLKQKQEKELKKLKKQEQQEEQKQVSLGPRPVQGAAPAGFQAMQPLLDFFAKTQSPAEQKLQQMQQQMEMFRMQQQLLMQHMQPRYMQPFPGLFPASDSFDLWHSLKKPVAS